MSKLRMYTWVEKSAAPPRLYLQSGCLAPASTKNPIEVGGT